MGTARTFAADAATVLHGRDFRRLFVTRLTSQAGDGAFQAGLASLLFFSQERAATAPAVAAALSVAVVPYTIVGPFAGVLLDRWRRRNVLVVVNAVRGVVVLAIAALVARGATGAWLYVAVLACLSLNRFFLSGLGAGLPHVVPAHELVMANAVAPTSGTIAAIAGGGLGYVVRERLGAADGTDAVILVCAASFFFAACLLARRMHRDLLGPVVTEEDGDGAAAVTTQPWRDAAAAAGGVVRGLVEGLAHLRSRRRAFTALAAIGAHRFAYGVTTVATVLLCRNTFNAPSDVDGGVRLLASVFAASGAGFAVAAVITPLVTQRLTKTGWIVTCYGMAAVLEAGLLVTLTVPSALVAAFGLGVAAQGSKICVDAIVQADIHDAFLGRVMSLYDMVFNLAFALAAGLCAAVLPSSGYVPWLYAMVALIYAATAVAYARAQRRDGLLTGALTTT